MSKRVFEQPKEGTPWAKTMSIPWIDADIKPGVKENPVTQNFESPQLLVWVDEVADPIGLGKYIKVSEKSPGHWVVSGYFGVKVTHWAYVNPPNA